MKKFILSDDLHTVYFKNRRFIFSLLFMLLIIYLCSLTNNVYAASSKKTKTNKVTNGKHMNSSVPPAKHINSNVIIPQAKTEDKQVQSGKQHDKSINPQRIKEDDDVDNNTPVQEKPTTSDIQADIDKFTAPKDSIINAIMNNNKRVDIGEAFLNQIASENNRLYYYDLYIKLALAKGYVVTSFIDYLNNYKNTNTKVLILRHDIDIADPATRVMFEIEKKNNVKATYYFRWATFDKNLIEELHNSGFEVGLHYETIATYCVKNNNYNITDEDMDKCRELLKQEIIDFKQKTGIDIQTIASHGNPINKQIGISNNMLFKGQNYVDYGIVCETYDEDILNNYVKSYICDGDILKNDGYSYQSNPIDSIMKDNKVIEFLSHPNHWNYNDKQRLDLSTKIPTYSDDNNVK